MIVRYDVIDIINEICDSHSCKNCPIYGRCTNPTEMVLIAETYLRGDEFPENNLWEEEAEIF